MTVTLEQMGVSPRCCWGVVPRGKDGAVLGEKRVLGQERIENYLYFLSVQEGEEVARCITARVPRDNSITMTWEGSRSQPQSDP